MVGGISLDGMRVLVRFLNCRLHNHYFQGTCTTRLDRTVLYSLCILLPYVIIAVSYVGIIIHVRQSRRRLRPSLQISTNRNNQSAYELPDQGDLKEQSQSSVDELEKHKKNKDLVERSKEKNMTIVIGIILVSYLTCTIPGAVIIQLDPAAIRYRYVSVFINPLPPICIRSPINISLSLTRISVQIKCNAIFGIYQFNFI